jgi:hypothetical protein
VSTCAARNTDDRVDLVVGSDVVGQGHPSEAVCTIGARTRVVDPAVGGQCLS